MALDVWKQSLSLSSQKLDFISGPKSNSQAYIYSQLQSIVSQYDPIELRKTQLNESALSKLFRKLLMCLSCGPAQNVAAVCA